jgi:hypothetical protein
MKKYKSINLSERCVEVYDAIQCGEANWDDVPRLLEGTIVINEMSVIKTLNNELGMMKTAPTGGEWLKKVANDVQRVYKSYLVSIENNGNEESFTDFVNYAIKKRPQDKIEDPELFWELVKLLDNYFTAEYKQQAKIKRSK